MVIICGKQTHKKAGTYEAEENYIEELCEKI
jgi:hypothetical protein